MRFVAPVPRFRRGKALWVSRLNCQIEPLPGARPAAAASGTAENKMALDDAATERGNNGVALSGTGAIGIWSISCIESRSTMERFYAPEFATTSVEGFAIAMDSGRFPTRIGGRKLWLARENTSI